MVYNNAWTDKNQLKNEVLMMSEEKNSGNESEQREQVLEARKKQLEKGLADSDGNTLSEEEQDFFWLCGKR